MPKAYRHAHRITISRDDIGTRDGYARGLTGTFFLESVLCGLVNRLDNLDYRSDRPHVGWRLVGPRRLENFSGARGAAARHWAHGRCFRNERSGIWGFTKFRLAWRHGTCFGKRSGKQHF